MKVLVIAPHPDDETLGCGGTMFRHSKEGDQLFWVIFTGISAEEGWPESLVKNRDAEIASVAKKYKFSDVFNFFLPTKKLDLHPLSDLIEKITEVYKKIEPEIIYMPYAYDVHTDHQIIAKALNPTIKWFRHHYIQKVFMYETPSESEFNFVGNNVFKPNVFVNISEHLNEKIKTMQIYQNEIGDSPFPRSEKTIRSLAAFRGSQSGYEAAEAFELVYERR